MSVALLEMYERTRFLHDSSRFAPVRRLQTDRTHRGVHRDSVDEALLECLTNLLWVLLLLSGYEVLEIRFKSPIEAIANVMLYFNSFVNPVLCLIVCKSAREDFKGIIRFLANVVGCGQREDMALDNTPGENSSEDASE